MPRRRWDDNIQVELGGIEVGVDWFRIETSGDREPSGSSDLSRRIRLHGASHCCGNPDSQARQSCGGFALSPLTQT
jgi:hypothetical protein